MKSCGLCCECKWWTWAITEAHLEAGECERVKTSGTLLLVDPDYKGKGNPFITVITLPLFGCVQWEGRP